MSNIVNARIIRPPSPQVSLSSCTLTTAVSKVMSSPSEICETRCGPATFPTFGGEAVQTRPVSLAVSLPPTQSFFTITDPLTSMDWPSFFFRNMGCPFRKLGNQVSPGSPNGIANQRGCNPSSPEPASPGFGLTRSQEQKDRSSGSGFRIPKLRMRCATRGLQTQTTRVFCTEKHRAKRGPCKKTSRGSSTNCLFLSWVFIDGCPFPLNQRAT